MDRKTLFRAITVLGALLVLDISARLIFSKGGFSTELAEYGAIVCLVWLPCRRLMAEFDGLREEVSEKTLTRMFTYSFSTALIVYVFLGQLLMKR